MTRWVVDASPLIFLAKLDRLDLLRRSAEEICVPPTVLVEVQAWTDSSATIVEQATDDWLQVVSPRLGVPAAGTGEVAATALALDLKADRVVLDDLAARRRVRRAGLQVVGTLGLRLAASLRWQGTTSFRRVNCWHGQDRS